MHLAPTRRTVPPLIALASLIAGAAPAPAQVWTPTGPVGAPVTSLDAVPGAGGPLLAVAQDTLYRSADGGQSWTPVLSGTFGISEVALSPADPSRAYALGQLQHLYRSEDGGLTWELSLTLGTDHFPLRLWTDPVEPGVAYFSSLWSILFSEDPTFLYRTGDGGVTWEVVWIGALVAPWDVGFGSGLEQVRLASLSDSLLRSEDGGLTWSSIDAQGLDGATLGEIAGDPATAGRFLASPFDGGLLESTDSGDSWHPYGVGLPGGSFLRLRFDPASPGTVYAAAASRGVYRSLDGGATWAPVGTGAPADRFHGRLDLALSGDPARLFAATSDGVQVADPAAVPPCVEGPATLCLQGGRFEARVAWQDFEGGAGEGRAIPLTEDTGAFWFFRDTNLELAVKVLNGTPVNGFFWNFYGSLSNVPFTLTVRDSETGGQRFYVNPARTFASRGDTRGFPEGPGGGGGAARRPESPDALGAPAVAAGLPATTEAPAPGTAEGWLRLGPGGGPIQAVVAGAKQPPRQYAASTGSGVFRSEDGGETWTGLPGGRVRPGDEVLEIHEGPDGVLYLLQWGGEIQRSDDGGASWTVLETGVRLTRTMAIDPSAPGDLYVAETFFPYGLSKSADSGASWQRLDAFPRELESPHDFFAVADLTLDAAGGTVWAATDHGVYRSVDKGESWQLVGTGMDAFTREIQALAAVPGAPGRLYAATGFGIFETLDGGDLWSWRGPGQSFEVESLTVDPADPRHLWAIASGELEESTDGGETWQPVASLPAPVHGLSPDPRADGTVYAATGDGVYRSADGGATWQLAVEGLEARDLIGLDARPDVPGRLLVADGTAVYRSADGGESWTRVLDEVAWYVESAPSDPATVYASGSNRVHRSTDGGLSWDQIYSTSAYVDEVWADPSDPDVAYVGVISNLSVSPPPADLQRTLDGGETWETVAFTSGGFPDLAIGPGAPGEPPIVLFGSAIWEVHRSTDGGASFERAAAAGLPPFTAVVELIADPLQPGRFLGSTPVDGLWETTDAGETWRRFGTGLPEGVTLRLLLDPGDPNVLYAAADGLGAFRSADRGATWHPVGPGAAGAPTGWLTLGLSGDPLRLHAATDRGVWSIPAAPGTAPCVPGPTTLCLQDGRFRVEVEWQDFEGGSGPGRAVPQTGDTGAFWFFDDANLELFVKVLDGRPVNGRFWVFYGSLSNVPFTLTVTDTVSGTPRVYENPERVFASRGDTAAF